MNDADKKWLLFWLRSEKGRSQIERLASGNQLSMRNLTQANLKSIVVRLPDKDERNELIRRVETLFAYADRLEAQYQKARTHIDLLTPALLDKAFRGELVPQDPNDEPASVLLERIQAERAQAPTAKPKRTTTQRKPKMTQLTKAAVQEAIRQLPKDTFSFDELRTSCPGDYEALKDILFDLLSEEESKLKQIFDPKAQAMRFVRGSR
jgi:type I restriction enzyme S subunit